MKKGGPPEDPLADTGLVPAVLLLFGYSYAFPRTWFFQPSNGALTSAQ